MGIDYAQLGKRIAAQRRALQMTQDDVAEATGLSNNYISNIENNHSIPSIETLMKVSEALQSTPDYFLLGINRQKDESNYSQVIKRLKLCNEKQLRLIDHFVTWLIDEGL